MNDEKILDSEVLSDEELEKVAGGNARQTSGDGDFLNSLGYQNQTYKIMQGIQGNNVEQAWASAGIICKTETEHEYDNRYFLEGKEISRKDAFIHVMKKRGWNQIAIDCFDFDSYSGKF